MTKHLATKEQLDTIYKSMGDNISFMYPSLLSSIKLYKELNSINEDSNRKNIWIDLVRIYYFVLFCHLDIISTLRAEFRAVSIGEKRIHLKYLNVIITEMIKAMFGFSGDKLCLWKRFSNDAGVLLNERHKVKIEELITNFKETYCNSDSKDCRNYAIHYDNDPLKVYSFLCNLSEETETEKVSKFLAILHELLLVINKLSYEQRLPLCYLQVADNSFWEKLNVFPDKDHALLLQTRNSVVSYWNTLDSIVKSYKLPNIVEQQFGIEGMSSRLHPLRETIHPILHLLFIYIDICCAVIAYLSSEHYIERQLNLRHLNMIVYEGFRKLYGFPNNKKNQEENDKNKELYFSFWKDVLYPCLMSSDNDCLKNKAQEIDSQLQMLADDSTINDDDLRQMSVHIREKRNKDYIPHFMDKLINMSPFIEMNKALKLLRLLPDIMKLNKEVTNIKYSDIKALQDRKTESMRNQLEAMRDLILQSCKDKSVQESINESTNKLLSLLNI